MGADQIIVHAAIILALAIVFRIVWAVREGIAWVIKAAVLGAVVFIVTQVVLREMQRSQFEVVAGSYVVAAVAVASTPKRSRYIPADVKRRVVARDLKGEKYSGKKHHIDHVWPHVSGGSNTVDNLRVIPKKENLRKGSKKPKITDLF